MEEKNKKKKFKKFILKIVFFLLMVIFLMIIFVMIKEKLKMKKIESGEIENRLEKVEEKINYSMDGESKIEDILLENIQVKKINNSKCEVMANVENCSVEYKEAQVMEIKAIDKEGNVIAEFSGILGKLAPYEKSEFYTQVLKDITNSEKLEFSISSFVGE